MKYENVLLSVSREVRIEILRGGNDYHAALAATFDSIAERRPFRKSLEALADQAETIILNWDIRRVGKLRELFPHYFPKSLQNKELICDYDANGNWAVFPKEGPQ